MQESIHPPASAAGGSSPFAIVAFGSSAGGLQALSVLLPLTAKIFPCRSSWCSTWTRTIAA